MTNKEFYDKIVRELNNSDFYDRCTGTSFFKIYAVDIPDAKLAVRLSNDHYHKYVHVQNGKLPYNRASYVTISFAINTIDELLKELLVPMTGTTTQHTHSDKHGFTVAVSDHSCIIQYGNTEDNCRIEILKKSEENMKIDQCSTCVHECNYSQQSMCKDEDYSYYSAQDTSDIVVPVGKEIDIEATTQNLKNGINKVVFKDIALTYDIVCSILSQRKPHLASSREASHLYIIKKLSVLADFFNNGWVPVNDYDQKYSIQRVKHNDNTEHVEVVDATYHLLTVNTIYFKNEKDAEEALRILGDDAKYLFPESI